MWSTSFLVARQDGRSTSEEWIESKELCKTTISITLATNMYPSFQVGLCLFVAGVLLVRFFLQRWRQHRIVQKYGCKPMVEYPSAGWGSDYTKEQEQAIRDGYFNASASEDFEKCGSSTFVRTTLDERMINTTEPLNHQALVTKLDDWHKEPRPAIRAFSRDNVVLQNGHAWRRSRDLVNPLFSRVELSDTENFRIFVDRMIDLIPRDGSTIDMQPLIRKLVS